MYTNQTQINNEKENRPICIIYIKRRSSYNSCDVCQNVVFPRNIRFD